MKSLIALALAPLALAAQDPFLFDLDPGAPVLVERTDLVIERTSDIKLKHEDIGFVERSTTRRKGDYADIWLLIAMAKTTRLSADTVIDGIWSSVRIDCVKGTIENHARSAVLADGTTLLRSNDGSPPRPILKGSNYENVADIACGRFANVGAPTFKSAAEAIASARAD